MPDVSEMFIKAMLVHFAIPESAKTDLERYWSDFRRDLGGYDDAVLSEAAGRLVRREGAGRYFPPLADCLWMCERVSEESHKSKPSGSKKDRSTAEMEAERAHLGRLNEMHESGETDQAARLLIILAVRSYQTQGWDFGSVSLDVCRVAVNKYHGPEWLVGIGKR